MGPRYIHNTPEVAGARILRDFLHYLLQVPSLDACHVYIYIYTYKYTRAHVAEADLSRIVRASLLSHHERDYIPTYGGCIPGSTAYIHKLNIQPFV